MPLPGGKSFLALRQGALDTVENDRAAGHRSRHSVATDIVVAGSSPTTNEIDIATVGQLPGCGLPLGDQFDPS
jgi:hypothetical protein